MKDHHRILIADGHPVCRFGLRTLLESEPNFAVCGETESALELQQLVQKKQPNAVICGLQLTQGSGLQVIHNLHAQHPNLPVLVVSLYDELLFAERCIRAGATGYIHKSAAPEILLEAVHQVLKKKLYVSSNVADQIIRAHVNGHAPTDAPCEAKLSDREMEVYLMIGQGFSTKRIANELCLSPKTIDSHREHIKEKLGIIDNATLLRRAIAWENHWL